MNVEPAKINQVPLGEDVRLIEIQADAGGVAAKLREIDQGLIVRFDPRGQYWFVIHQWHPQCPHNGEGHEGSEYLVNTARAHHGSTGAWLGLDNRLVERMKEIGSESYDFAAELERRRLDREKRTAKAKAEAFGEITEKAAHALRKDLGSTSRIVVPRSA